MPIISIPFGQLGANCNIVYNDKDAVVIDPCDNSDSHTGHGTTYDTDYLMKFMKEKGLTLRAILLTHLHFDHASGCAELQKRSGLPVYVGEEDWEMRDVLLGRSMLFGLSKVEDFDTNILTEGEHKFGSLSCKVIHAPGHSPGSLCYYFAEEKALIAGDVLFHRSVGRSDFPGGNARMLANTLIEKIYTLPFETVVYCGHGESTLVGEEAKHNPFCTL